MMQLRWGIMISKTGHAVYDRVRRESDFPMLGANAVSIVSGELF
ncbi:MAG: hypothetical protein R2727_02050 [Bacteroidales bacterium]